MFDYEHFIFNSDLKKYIFAISNQSAVKDGFGANIYVVKLEGL